jgi:hypothetical protein
LALDVLTEKLTAEDGDPLGMTLSDDESDEDIDDDDDDSDDDEEGDDDEENDDGECIVEEERRRDASMPMASSDTAAAPLSGVVELEEMDDDHGEGDDHDEEAGKREQEGQKIVLTRPRASNAGSSIGGAEAEVHDGTVAAMDGDVDVCSSVHSSMRLRSLPQQVPRVVAIPRGRSGGRPIVTPGTAKKLQRTKHGRRELEKIRHTARRRIPSSRKKARHQAATAARMEKLREQHCKAQKLLQVAVKGRMDDLSLHKNLEPILQCSKIQLDKDHVAITIKKAVALHDFFRLQ